MNELYFIRQQRLFEKKKNISFYLSFIKLNSI